MFEKFGEFDSCEELNRAAAARLAEGDTDAIYTIAEENGIDRESVVEEPEQKEQPELPVLRNNDRRKEWLDTFHDWPVWFEVPEAGETYYRYDLPDGSSLVICEYHLWLEWKEKWSNENPDSVGTREYLLKPGYHYLADCQSSRTAMIEKLKEVQKKG